MPTIERSSLHVEGTDDVHVIRHLLLRHGIDCPIKGEKRPAHEFSASVPKITPAGDKDAVLNAMEAGVPVSNGRPVGFVLDAARFRARVGVWLMPDNRQSGALEQFLPLLPVAETSTANAKIEGADFPDSKESRSTAAAD